MDEDISRWVMEFLLRHSTSDVIVNKIFSKLPVSNNDLHLQKLVLLRSIQSEISNSSVSEMILERLETIEKLEKRDGKRIMNSMKVAYCAVAVECTVKYLRVSVDNLDRYIEAVTRIWRGRVENLIGSELLTDQLGTWKDDLEAAVFDTEVHQRLLKKNTQNETLHLVAAYLEEAREMMGPTFLELAAAKMRQLKEKKTETDVRVEKLERLVDMVGEEAASNGVGDRGAGAKQKGKGVLKDNVLPRRKHVASHRRTRAIKITDDKELDSDAEGSKYDTIPTPNVSKAQEALKSSCLELQSIVQDPLPEALCMAQAVIFGMTRKNQIQEPSTGNPSLGNGNVLGNDVPSHEPSVDRQNDVGKDARDSSGKADINSVRASEGDQKTQTCSNVNNERKPSLLERNSTARTYEWSDSIEDSPEGPLNNVKRLHLPSPKRRLVSPLKKQNDNLKFAQRRQKKRWTVEEEETLRKGVAECGRGNWKVILNSYPEAFAERTEVDLKDKWRNMTRR